MILLMPAVIFKQTVHQDIIDDLLQTIDGCKMMPCRRSIKVSRERSPIEDWSVCMIRMMR